MKLRKGDCGHWIPEDLRPSGVTYNAHQDKDIPVYLCPPCRVRLLDHASLLNLKVQAPDSELIRQQRIAGR